MIRLPGSTQPIKRAFLAFIVFVVVQNAAPFDDGLTWPSSVEAADSLHTLTAYQRAILDLEPGERRNALYNELFERIDSGQIEIHAGPELDRFMGFLAGQLTNVLDPTTVRAKIATFLVRNPHPAAKDALWRVADEDHSWHQEKAREALVALRDERVLELFLDDVRDPVGHDFRAAFRMIGELGSARAIEPLKAMLKDTSIKKRFEKGLRAQQSKMKHERDDEWYLKYANDHYQMYKKAARRALRDVRLQVNTGIVTPFDLDDHAHETLARQGFVILPEPANELYELLRAEYPYVTVDIAFHAFMLLAGAAFDDLERLVLRPRLEAFASGMIRAGQDRLRFLCSEREVDLAHRNIALFAVVAALLKGADIELDDVPASVVAKADDELTKIKNHAGVDSSSLFNVTEDFTKFKPRGRYDSSPEHRDYFQAMLYLGRMKFRIESEPETARALLLLDVLESNPRLRQAWKEIDDLLAMFFGRLDDPGVMEYEESVRAAVPGITSNRALAVLRDVTALDEFRNSIQARPAPRILTMVPDQPDPTLRDQNRGFRVLGQRYSRSIDVFQQYMEAALTREMPGFPSGLHVASSLLGSEKAEHILQAEGRPSTFEVVDVPRPPGDPFRSLREGYLNCYSPLFEHERARPAFTWSSAWQKRLINSALGGWAEVMHTTMLYCKDANVYCGASMMLDRFHGYVDPYPEFFLRLGQFTERFVALLETTGLFDQIDAEIADVDKKLAELPENIDGYEERIRLTEESIHATREMFGDLQDILSGLEGIARKELRAEEQSVMDGIFLKSLRGKFMRLAFNWSNSGHHQQSMALISDPVTEYFSRRCLQVGVGRPLALYVAVPFDNRTFICRGPVYSYYEFLRPIEDRLDDETWRKLSSDLTGTPAPWVADHPDLGYSRWVRRGELEELLAHEQPDGRNTSGGREPWQTRARRDPTRRLITARIAQSDFEILLKMADKEAIHVGVRRFALQKLKDFGADPRVLDAYRRQLAAIEGTTDENNLFHTRLYYTIQGLGSCGRQALPELDRAEVILQATRMWKHPKSRINEPYLTALKESRRLIAAFPAGISRSETKKAGK